MNFNGQKTIIIARFILLSELCPFCSRIGSEAAKEKLATKDNDKLSNVTHDERDNLSSR
jgi:hypothetical protein